MAGDTNNRYDGGTDPKKAAQKTCEWIKSGEGERVIREAINRGTPFADRLKEARKIDPESIRKPMGF